MRDLAECTLSGIYMKQIHNATPLPALQTGQRQPVPGRVSAWLHRSLEHHLLDLAFLHQITKILLDPANRILR